MRHFTGNMLLTDLGKLEGDEQSPIINKSGMANLEAQFETCFQSQLNPDPKELGHFLVFFVIIDSDRIIYLQL